MRDNETQDNAWQHYYETRNKCTITVDDQLLATAQVSSNPSRHHLALRRARSRTSLMAVHGYSGSVACGRQGQLSELRCFDSANALLTVRLQSVQYSQPSGPHLYNQPISVLVISLSKN